MNVFFSYYCEIEIYIVGDRSQLSTTFRGMPVGGQDSYISLCCLLHKCAMFILRSGRVEGVVGTRSYFFKFHNDCYCHLRCRSERLNNFSVLTGVDEHPC